MGTGILNWVFALPAFFTIDTFGRRFLLLVTFPFLCLMLLWTGMSFFIGETDADGNCVGNCNARTAMITTGMYLYEVFYSPGMGPVPFSYSAEVFPIQVSLVMIASVDTTDVEGNRSAMSEWLPPPPSFGASILSSLSAGHHWSKPSSLKALSAGTQPGALSSGVWVRVHENL